MWGGGGDTYPCCPALNPLVPASTSAPMDWSISYALNDCERPLLATIMKKSALTSVAGSKSYSIGWFFEVKFSFRKLHNDSSRPKSLGLK